MPRPRPSIAALALASSLVLAVPGGTDASAASTATPRAAKESALGQVRFVTDKRAYLDRGTAHGLALGQALTLTRGGRAMGSCTVESASDHEATCTGGRPHVGDTFRVTRARARKVQARVPTLAAVVDEEVLATRANQVADTQIDKVDFKGKRTFRSHAAVEVTPGFSVWFTRPDPQGGTYVQERVDGAIRGVEIGSSSFLFDGAFSAIRWTTPSATTRFRPDTPTQFYLWEAEASRRVREGGTTVAVGRLWPFHTPGLTLLDGVQLGRQNAGRTAEGGVYGGLIPTAAGLTPTFDIWAGGLFGALSQVGDRTSLARLAREELRIGMWRGASQGVVTEAEGIAQIWIGAVTVGGGGRARWAAQGGHGAPEIEHAHLDLGLRPTIDSAAGLHLRYVGVRLLPDSPLRAETPMSNGAIHALADVRLKLTSGFALAATAGAHREGDAGRHQLHAGVEVRFPRLLGRAGGLWVGAGVQEGWLRGENAYVQYVGRAEDRVQVMARLFADVTQFETPTAMWNLHEVGGSVSVDGVLTSWLRLRAWSLLRAPILVQGQLPNSEVLAGMAGLSLAGSI